MWRWSEVISNIPRNGIAWWCPQSTCSSRVGCLHRSCCETTTRTMGCSFEPWEGCERYFEAAASRQGPGGGVEYCMDGKILQAWHIFEKSTNVVLQHISYRYTRLQDGIKTDFFLSISELDYLMSFRTLDRIFFRLPPYLHSHVVISMIQVWKSIFEACPTQDMFTAVSFSKVKGMPWVCPEAPAELIKVASELKPSVSAKAANHFEEALQEDADAVVKPQIVICGSLYLVADVISSISKPARGLK